MQVMITSLSRAILDHLVRPGPLGLVHSAFDRAVNIRLNDASRIIALTFESAGGLPYAFMLAESSPTSFLSRGITTGQKVILEANDCLVIDGARDRYDYSKATLWDPLMVELPGPVDIQAFGELLDWAAAYVYGRANLAGLAPLLINPRQLLNGALSLENTPDLQVAKLAAPYVTGLLNALREENPASLNTAVSHLIGYGIGGTPSGDDLLVGIMAALTCYGDPRAARLQRLLRTCLEEQLHADATSLLSLTVLLHAMDGEFSEKIHEVTRLLTHPDNPESLESSLQRLLLHGATSGSEMFLGVCLGFLLLQVDKSTTGKYT